MLPKKHKFSVAEHCAGGHAHAAKERKRRDKQLTGKAQRLAELSSLKDLRWRPALQTLARVTLLMERSYTVLKERSSLLDRDGELCRSIDVFRRLAETQSILLKHVGLMPGTTLPEPIDREIEAAFRRVEALKQVSGNSDGSNGPTP